MKRLIAASTLSIFAIAALGDPVDGHNPLRPIPWWAVQVVLVAASAALLWWYVHTYYENEIRPGSPRKISDIPKVPDREAYELQRVAGKIRLNATQARIFTLSILEPAELRPRVSERYIPGQRALSQEVAIEIQVPNRLLSLNAHQADHTQPGTNNVFYPILVIPKGEFNDNLEVSSADAGRLPVLSYKEYLQLAAGILRLFLCIAYDLPLNERPPQFPRPRWGSADLDVVHLEHRALCEIIKRAQANAIVKATRGISPVAPEANDVAKLLEELPVPEARKVYLRLAAALVRRLSLHYALVARTPLDPDGRLLIRYKRTLIPELELSPDKDERDPTVAEKSYRRFKGWLRILFGTRPVSVTVSLDNAWTCQSYHVRVDAPEGLYLARQQFVASARYLEKTAKGAPTILHYRFRRRLGQPYAHFYGRFFPIPIQGERRPKIQLQFFEVPPGSDFRAAIAAASCFGLVWLVGFVMSRTPDPGTDAPAFLLVFPGVAASWLGFDAPAHRLFEGTLAARLSLTLTTLISLSASGVFMLNRSAIHFLYGSLPGGTSVLGIYKWSWALLAFASFLNTLYVMSRWLRHSWSFKQLAERPDPDGASET